MNLVAALTTADNWFAHNSATITGLSDRIWDFAEPGLCEIRSAEALCCLLRGHGFSVEAGVAGLPTAFLAQFGTGRPRIGLMCEYDATPGEAQRPSPFPDPDPSRWSGFTDLHNGLGAASAGAAAALADTMKAHGLSGSIVVFGTPAEKLCIGKPVMARAGFFDRVDAVIAWHPRRYSTVEWDDGPGCYQAEIFDFLGRSAYGGAPAGGINALYALVHMMAAVKDWRGELPPRITVNEIITNGGDHPTAIPAHAQIWYVYRGPDRTGIDRVRGLLKRAAEGAAEAVGASYESRVVAATRPWLPNHALAKLCYRNLERVGAPRFSASAHTFAHAVAESLKREVGGPALDEELTDPEAGATADFAGGADDVNEFCWHAPTARIYIAYGLAAGGLPNWARSAFTRTEVAHTTVISAARVMASSVLDVLGDPACLEAATAEFRQRVKEAGTVAPLLDDDVTDLLQPETAPPYVRAHLLRRYYAEGAAS